jgi:hypothetical protein
MSEQYTYCQTCGARDDATDRGLSFDVHAKIAELERQNIDLQAANNAYLKRARDAWPPDAKFNDNERVRTKPGSKGAEWEGWICGWYRSPPLTPLGYAVRSAFHNGAVQIFAEARLERVNAG